MFPINSLFFYNEYMRNSCTESESDKFCECVGSLAAFFGLELNKVMMCFEKLSRKFDREKGFKSHTAIEVYHIELLSRLDKVKKVEKTKK